MRSLGILVALVYVGNDFIMFAVQPITIKSCAAGLWATVVQFGVAGAIIGVIYKSSSPAVIRFQIHETIHVRVYCSVYLYLLVGMVL